MGMLRPAATAYTFLADDAAGLLEAPCSLGHVRAAGFGVTTRGHSRGARLRFAWTRNLRSPTVVRRRRAQPAARVLLSTIVATAALAFNSPAAYAEPSVSIAGVHLGMTPGQVQRLLGQPLSKSRILPGVSMWAYQVWRYPDRLLVEFRRYPDDKRHLRVKLIATRSPRDRFSNGVHVGSPVSVVRKRFHPLLCSPYSLRNETVTLCQWYVAGQELCVPGVELWVRRTKVYKIELTPTPADGGCPRVVRS